MAQQSGEVLQLGTTYLRYFFFGTPAVLASMAVNLSSNGGAFAANTGGHGAIAEIANGWYTVLLSSGDTGTLGDLAYHITSSSGGPLDFQDQVVTHVLGNQLAIDNSFRALVGSPVKQNTTVILPFTLTSFATGQALTGATGITAQRSLGGAGFAPCANPVTEIGGTTMGAGNYSIVLAPGDTNSSVVVYHFTAPGANDVNIVLYFQP
jgi:hypothetical protein